jgi:hypothetical protein
MAHTPDLFIEGERIPKVKAVAYEVTTAKDVRGKPSDQARLAPGKRMITTLFSVGLAVPPRIISKPVKSYSRIPGTARR